MNKRHLAKALGVFLLALPGLALCFGCSTLTSDTPGFGSAETKAAIVDQLYSLQPNPIFVDGMVEELEAGGFEVDIYQGDEVTVDLYRKLPTDMN